MEHKVQWLLENNMVIHILRTCLCENIHYFLNAVTQTVKNLLAMQEIWVQSLGGEIPWSRKWQPTPVFLPGESHGQRSLVGYSPWDHKKPDTTEWLTLAFIVWMVTEGWWIFYLSLEVRGHYFQCCCCEVSGNWRPTSMCVIISFSLWDFEILYSFLVFWRTNIYWDDVT